MSKNVITDLLISSNDLDRWVAHHMKGTPVEIAGKPYHIDSLRVRGGEGLADVTSVYEYEDTNFNRFKNDSVAYLENGDEYHSNASLDYENPLTKVDRSLLNRKGKREADKVAEHQHVSHSGFGLTFDEAVSSAYCLGKAIRRRGWLKRYWSVEEVPLFKNGCFDMNDRKLIETFVSDLIEGRKEIAVTCDDRNATDWEAIDID